MSKRKFGEIDEDEDEEINNQIRDKINKKISLGTENKKKLYANLQKYIKQEDFTALKKMSKDTVEYKNFQKKIASDALTKYFNNLQEEKKKEEDEIISKGKKSLTFKDGNIEKYESFVDSRKFGDDGLSTKKKSKTSRRRKSKSMRRKSKTTRRRKSKTSRRKKSKTSRIRKPIEYTLKDKYFKGKLKLFSKDYCGFCKKLKEMLNTDLGLKFEEISQEKADEFRVKCEELKDSKPFTTVPQLFSVIDNKIFYLGEYSHTEKIIEELKKMKQF